MSRSIPMGPPDGLLPWDAPELLDASDPRLDFDPNLERARALLMAYVPPDEAQAAERVKILGFLLEHPDALLRTCLAGHLTAAALLIDAEHRRVLLTHHRKLGRWLQLGGHCDGDGNLAAAALREGIEESGIPDLRIDPRPFDLDVHTIPARPARGTRPQEPEHLHLDVRFLVYAPPGAVPRISDESLELAWVGPGELPRYSDEPSVTRLFRRALGPAESS